MVMPAFWALNAGYQDLLYTAPARAKLAVLVGREEHLRRMVNTTGFQEVLGPLTEDEDILSRFRVEVVR